VVVTLKFEDRLGNVGVPDKDIMVRSCGEDQVVILIPIEGENALGMTLERSFGLHAVHTPKADFTIKSSGG